MAEKKFRISSVLKNIIGKDLITNDFVAIFELVKNSFDARATRVDVVFDFQDNNDGTLYIVDNGKGMSSEDIERKWLFLAYSAKNDGTEDIHQSEGPISYAGNKGVGRFSCDRLGRYLEIQTRTATDSFVNVISVDWAAFELDPLKEFKDISVDVSVFDKFNLPRRILEIDDTFKGTILKVTNLRDYGSWTREKLILLKRSLAKLIDPFGGVLDKRTISLRCDREREQDDLILKTGGSDLNIINGVVKNGVYLDILKKSTAIIATLSDGVLDVELNDRSRMIYKSQEDVSQSFPFLRSSSIKIDFGFINRAAKIIFARRMGVRLVRYGSIFLTHNGYRIFPVGDEGNDFWGIEHRKQQGTRRFLGSRELFGCVRIESGNLEFFKESSSRDKGLIDTLAVQELKSLLEYCLRKLESYVIRVLWPDLEDKDREVSDGVLEAKNTPNVVEFIRRLVVGKSVRVVEINPDIVSIIKDKRDESSVIVNDILATAGKVQDQSVKAALLDIKARVQKNEAETIKAKEIAQQAIESERKLSHDLSSERNKRKTVEVSLSEEKKRNLFLSALSNTPSEYYQTYMHQIGLECEKAIDWINDSIKKGARNDSLVDVDRIAKAKDSFIKIRSLSRFASQANFRAGDLAGDMVDFIAKYISEVANGYVGRFLVSCEIEKDATYCLRFDPVALSIVIDNFIDNAKKAHATKIIFSLAVNKGMLFMDVIDNGNGLHPDATDENIFEKGFSRTNGSGWGLYFNRNFFKGLNGSLSLASTESKGLHFIARVSKS